MSMGYWQGRIKLFGAPETKLNSVALVRERTIPTERPPPVGEVIALGSKNISAPYFKQCFFRGGGYYPPD